jgi:glycine reductase complex component B subunit alpha and beta
MRLTLDVHPVSQVRLGGITRLSGDVLTIDAAELRDTLLQDNRLEKVDFEVVQPGENCRFGAIYDVLEPRAKEPGDGSDFPGALGPVGAAGRGTTHVLRGSAVTVLEGGVAGRVIEMSGPAAEYTPYAKLCHVLVMPHMRPGLERHVVTQAQRLVSLKTSVYLGRAGIGEPAALQEVYETGGPSEPKTEDLPRVAYIGQVHSRQRVAEVDEAILYGCNTNGMLPVVLHPNEWLDGAVLPGNSGAGSAGVETYFYQNHPIVSELYRWHQEGRIQFVGTIATMAGSDNFDRDLNASMSAQLAKWNLGADAAVLSKVGGGAPHADMALTARNCERLGIRTAVQVGPPDLSADRTVESGMLFDYPEVDAIIYNSGGQYFQWPAAAVERIIAPTPEAIATFDAIKELTASRVSGVTSQQGASRLRTLIY